MIFCRGCGKQIHDTALNCPQCGAIQRDVVNKTIYHWTSITAFVIGIVVFLLTLTEPDGKWDHETVLGAMILGATPISFGLYSFTQPSENGRWMGATGVFIGVFVVLVAFGSM